MRMVEMHMKDRVGERGESGHGAWAVGPWRVDDRGQQSTQMGEVRATCRTPEVMATCNILGTTVKMTVTAGCKDVPTGCCFCPERRLMCGVVVQPVLKRWCPV